MWDALAIGATGMQAQQLHVETIANNLVNANTTGFKKARVGFTDLMVREGLAASAAAPPPGMAPAQRTTAGVGVVAVNRLFEPGEIRNTGGQLDVAIRGDGFLAVTLPDGTAAYTRGGALKVNADGVLSDQAGHPLRPAIAVPDNVRSLTISDAGRVLVALPQQAAPVDAGQLDVVRFSNPSALTALGDGLYRASPASGEPTGSRAGEDGVGTIAQGFLEGSNVKMVDEMVALMLAQRAYEASVKIVQAADEMLGMVNNLRR